MGKGLIIDTSAILAVLFKEAKGLKVAELLEAQSSNLMMSTVNLAETLILLKDRQPQFFDSLRDDLYTFTIRYIPVTENQAQIASEARGKYPLNLGDCFAYALAKVEGLPVLTLDSDFKKTDIEIIFF